MKKQTPALLRPLAHPSQLISRPPSHTTRYLFYDSSPRVLFQNPPESPEQNQMLHDFLVRKTPLPLQQGHVCVCGGGVLEAHPQDKFHLLIPSNVLPMIQQHFCPCSSCFLKFCPKQTNTAESGVFLFYQVMYRHVWTGTRPIILSWIKFNTMHFISKIPRQSSHSVFCGGCWLQINMNHTLRRIW